MNALALHLNNALYCARKKTPRRDMNSRNPLIAGITLLDSFRDNLRVSLVPALNAPQKKRLEWWKHLRNGLFDSRRRRQSSMTQFSYCVSSQNKPQTVLRFIVPKPPRKKWEASDVWRNSRRMTTLVPIFYEKKSLRRKKFKKKKNVLSRVRLEKRFWFVE